MVDLSSSGDPARSSSGSSIAALIPMAATVAAGVLVALAVLSIFRSAPTALTAIGVGVLLALALDPVLIATQRRLKCSRAVGTVVIGSGLAVALGSIAFVLGPKAASQATDFADELPQTVEKFYDWPLVGGLLQDADAVGKVEQFLDDLPSTFDSDRLADLATRFLTSFGLALLVLVIAVSVLVDGAAIVERFRRLLPAERRERADELGRLVYRSLARYFAGSVAVAVLNGLVILAVGLALGIPLAPLAAVWAMVTNLIPQVGGFLGGTFFVLLAVSEGPVPGVIALVVFLLYQQFENNVIQPTVIGKAVDLSPPTTMLAALIGGAAAGVPGALVATPLLGAIKSVWKDMHGPGSAGADDRDDVDDPGDSEQSVVRTLLARIVSR